MAKLKVEIFEGEALSATVKVPAWVVTGASSLLPKIGGQQFAQRVQLDQLAQMLAAPGVSGQLLEIEDHAGKDRIVISLVGDDDQ